eukprot:gene10660-12341_t
MAWFQHSFALQLPEVPRAQLVSDESPECSRTEGQEHGAGVSQLDLDAGYQMTREHRRGTIERHQLASMSWEHQNHGRVVRTVVRVSLQTEQEKHSVFRY